MFRPLAAAACLLTGLASPAWGAYVNTTAGGSLRPGVYGRIEIGRAPPPPLIYNRPVVASRTIPAPGVKPVYLYVPPGQVRKWPKYCGKYQACSVPVYFVRMDNSPSRLGKWKSRGGTPLNPGLGMNVMGGPPGFRD